jgi:uncharacterized protein (TIGR00251 family)
MSKAVTTATSFRSSNSVSLKISVQVKINSKVESVEKLDDGSFVVRVHAPPVEGKANERVCELLAEHFNVPKSRVALVAGGKSKKKIFEIAIH